MKKSKTEIIPRCPACGTVGSMKTGPTKRRATYRGISLALPKGLLLTECTACGEGFLDDEEANAYSDAVDAAYDAELRRRARAALARLEGFITQTALETLLHLSHGYLSKLRNDAKAPSATLVSQLALLAADPKRRIAELERYWATPAR